MNGIDNPLLPNEVVPIASGISREGRLIAEITLIMVLAAIYECP